MRDQFSVKTNRRCMKVVGVRSRLGAPPSFQLPLTIHNTENFVHIELSLHLEIKETSLFLFLFQSFISRFFDGRNTGKVNTISRKGGGKKKNVKFSTLTGVAGQPKCGKSYTFFVCYFQPLVCHWCITDVSLVYHLCIPCILLVCHQCVIAV